MAERNNFEKSRLKIVMQAALNYLCYSENVIRITTQY
jgi:hypothetical protein